MRLRHNLITLPLSDPMLFLQLKNDEDTIAKALEGDYREEK